MRDMFTGWIVMHTLRRMAACCFVVLLLLTCGALPLFAEPAVSLEDISATAFDTQKETPKRFQYHWRMLMAKKGGTLGRRVVVEREGPKHAMLIMTEEGYPLAHMVNNVTFCLSEDNAGNGILYSGLGFHYWFGVDVDGRLGFTWKGVIPSDGSSSKCDVPTLLDVIRGSVPTVSEIDSGVHSLKSPRGRLCILASSKDEETRRVESVCLRSPELLIDIYGFSVDTLPSMTILDFASNGRRYGELNAKMVSLDTSNSYPKELNNLCANLSVAQDEAKTFSNSYHLRFVRDSTTAKGLVLRKQVEQAYQVLQSGDKRKDTLEKLSTLLDLFQPVAAAPTNEVGDFQDPYVLAWRTECALGPLAAAGLRESLESVIANSKEQVDVRVGAFRLLCQAGWPPSHNAEVLELRASLAAVVPEDMVKCGRHLHWPLVEARNTPVAE